MRSKEEIEQLTESNYPISLWTKEESLIRRLAFKNGYIQCQEDMMNDFLSLIEEYKEEELPNRNKPYHYEAEIDSGLNRLIEFIKNKQD